MAIHNWRPLWEGVLGNNTNTDNLKPPPPLLNYESMAMRIKEIKKSVGAFDFQQRIYQLEPRTKLKVEIVIKD